MNESDPGISQTKVRSLAGAPQHQFEDEIDLLDYVEVIVRRRWMILFTTFVVVLGTLAYVSLLPVTYVAQASLLPLEMRNFGLGSSKDLQQVQSYGQILETLKGATVRRGVGDRLVPYIKDGQTDSMRLSDYFGSRNTKQALDALAACSGFQQDESGVITITVSARDSVLAAAIANAYVDELQLFYTQKLQRKSQEGLKFIEDRLAMVEAELQVVEDSLLVFLERNVFIPDNSPISFQISRLQRLVDIRSSVYNQLVNEYELARIKVQQELPSFEVLSEARPIDATSDSEWPWFLLSLSLGLLISVVQAFIFEYIHRTRKSGRLEPIRKSLRADVNCMRRLLGKDEIL